MVRFGTTAVLFSAKEQMLLLRRRVVSGEPTVTRFLMKRVVIQPCAAAPSRKSHKEEPLFDLTFTVTAEVV
jgi:hypothetical protein